MRLWTDAKIAQVPDTDLVLKALDDPFLLEALREVDALTPAAPALLPPEYKTSARSHRPHHYVLSGLPASWSYDQVNEESVAPNGTRLTRAAVELHGWAWAEQQVKGSTG